jgi:hypothetical protein
MVFLYIVLEYYDQRRHSKAIDKIIEDELSGWETHPVDLTREDKGNWTRRKLTDENAVLLTRTSQLLHRLAELR